MRDTIVAGQLFRDDKPPEQTHKYTEISMKLRNINKNYNFDNFPIKIFIIYFGIMFKRNLCIGIIFIEYYIIFSSAKSYKLSIDLHLNGVYIVYLFSCFRCIDPYSGMKLKLHFHRENVVMRNDPLDYRRLSAAFT